MTAPRLTLSRLLLVAAIPFCAHAQTAPPQPPPPYTITFPQDLYDHPNTGTEWWYYTGNLTGLNGKPYGFELTFFRSYAPTGLPPGEPQVVPVIFADLAVSDLEGQRFFFHKSLATLPSSTAGITEKPWSIHLGNWQLDQPKSAEGLFHLNAQQPDFGLDLDLLPEQPPVLNGKDGLFILDGSDGQGNEFYEYYSYPACSPLARSRSMARLSRLPARPGMIMSSSPLDRARPFPAGTGFRSNSTTDRR